MRGSRVSLCFLGSLDLFLYIDRDRGHQISELSWIHCFFPLCFHAGSVQVFLSLKACTYHFGRRDLWLPYLKTMNNSGRALSHLGLVPGACEEDSQ